MIDKICRLCGRYFVDPKDTPERDWAVETLGLDDLEVERLLDDIPAPEALAGEEFNQAWEPQTTGAVDSELANAGSTESSVIDTTDGPAVVAMTQDAGQRIREKEEALSKARNAEERIMVERDTNTFRLNLIFSGDEAVIIKEALGASPAVRLLELCKADIEASAPA